MVPAVTKKSADHYVVFKKVRDMWLSLDNTEVKKANMSGMFRVNLAFYHNINSSKCVDYNIDFAAIKQGRARRCPPLLVKSHPKYSGQKGKGKKSSAQPQLSIPDDPSKEFVGEGPILQNEVSAGDIGDIQSETSETSCPKNMSQNASLVLTSVSSNLEVNYNEASKAQPGTAPYLKVLLPIPHLKVLLILQLKTLLKYNLCHLKRVHHQVFLTKLVQSLPIYKRNLSMKKVNQILIRKLCMPIHLKQNLPLWMPTLKQRGVAVLLIWNQ